MSRFHDAVGACYVDLLRAAGRRKLADPEAAEPERDDTGANRCSRCRGLFAGYPAGAQVADRALCRRCNGAKAEPLAGVLPLSRRNSA